MIKAPLTSDWDEYIKVLREDAHQLLAWGYGDTRPKLADAKDEYEMTGLLAEAMEARIDAPETPERFTLYAVHNEKPTSPSGELGKKRPRLDIQIQRCGVKPKPSFTFEAKRLRDDAGANKGDTMRHYLGADGLLRFIGGRYGADSREAAMLGCVEANDAEFWFAQVRNAFDFDAANGGKQLASVGGLEHVAVVPEFPDEYVSVHKRSSGTSIRIFHLFIDCISSEAA
jgi:hypothetical protein